MKKILCLLSLLVTLSAQAQFTRLLRHPEIPREYDAVFVDLVKGYYGGVARSSYGQYFGQMSPEQDAYGYGIFFTDHDGEICGQFRNGNLLMGIRRGTAIVRVGTEDHYTAYDLLTGEAQYIFLNDEKYHLDQEHLEAWKFMQLEYANGDKYVGETRNGQRDGYGIYYYNNGNFYYGPYKDNKPIGYGALFHTDNRVSLEYWDGPQETLAPDNSAELNEEAQDKEEKKENQEEKQEEKKEEKPQSKASSKMKAAQ